MAEALLNEKVVSFMGMEYNVKMPGTLEEMTPIDRPEKSVIVTVTGVPKSTSEQKLKKFFENRSMSGGGPVECVISKAKDTFLVVFKEFEGLLFTYNVLNMILVK